MRGKKKLVLGIAVLSTTGMLVFTATFPQQQIMQTEGTFQLSGNGTAGIMTESISDDQLDEILEQAVTVEKHDSITVAASASDEKSDSDKKSKIKKQAAKESDTKTKEKVSDKTNNTKEKASDNTKKKNSNKKKAEKTSEENKASEKSIKQNTSKIEKAAADEKSDTEKKSKEKNTETNKAKVNTVSTTSKKKAANEKDSDKNENDSDKVEDKDIDTDASEKKAEKKNSKESDSDKKSAAEKKWANKLMADVDDYLNIRKSADTESKIMGKLRKGDVATVIKEGETWTKIKSGSVSGYVKNKFCVYGTKAYKLANKICGTYATVQADGLRIRKKASKNAVVLEAAEEGDKLIVNTKAKEKDGWVTVKYNDENAFVSEKFVDVALVTGKAISIEEELEQIAAQQKAEEAAQAEAVSASSGSVTVQNNAAQVSASDLTLLSAIIYCEAGGESYAGQVAVGAVVMNRVRSGSYPNTISGVVYQSGQFSPVANGALARALSNGSYRNCTSAAQEALAGADNTGGAKFFHRVNGDAGLVIGNHVFY